MVDPRGVEPLSENPLSRLSSWAVCYLISRGVAQTDTRHLTAALFWMTGSRTNHRCTYPADLTHRGEPQGSHRVRVALRHGTAVRQPERLSYRLRLILGWTVYRDYPARHAYLPSESPSKPLRAQRKSIIVPRGFGGSVDIAGSIARGGALPFIIQFLALT